MRPGGEDHHHTLVAPVQSTLTHLTVEMTTYCS